MGHLHAGAAVGLCQVVLKAPAPFADAEHQIDQGAAGQQQVADQEVLGVQHVLAEQGMEVAEYVVAQHAGKACQEDEDAVDDNRLLAAPAEVVNAGGQQVLEHGNDGGEAGEGHEQEEQGTPDPAAGHVDEHAGQSHEDQSGALGGFHVEGEACGEDNQTGHQSHEGIQTADADGLAGQRVIFGHEAAENLNGANAEAQREEGLVHGGGDYVAHTHFTGALEVGQQVEPDALSGTGEQQAVDREDNDQGQQTQHHDFGDALQTFLKTGAADQETNQNGNDHPESHLTGVGQHVAEYRIHGLSLETGEGAGGKLYTVAKHPAGNRGIIHHQNVVAQHTEDAVEVPFASGGLQCLIALQRALAASTANSQLHGQHGHTHDEQEQQIKQDKHAAAICAGDVWELPHITDTNGAACTYQQESQSGLEIFSLHTIASSRFS